jgi:hypothetical protein
LIPSTQNSTNVDSHKVAFVEFWVHRMSHAWVLCVFLWHFCGVPPFMKKITMAMIYLALVFIRANLLQIGGWNLYQLILTIDFQNFEISQIWMEVLYKILGKVIKIYLDCVRKVIKMRLKLKFDS